MKTRTEKVICDYVELYDVIQAKTGSDDVAIVILQEIGKDKRARQMATENMRATNKQKKWLKDLGIEFSDSISRKEASALIEENAVKA